jgi:hypothetical protein
MKWKAIATISVCACLFLSCVRTTKADTLWSETIVDTGGGRSLQPPLDPFYSYFYSARDFANTDGVSIMHHDLLSSTSINQTFVATAANQTNFPTFVARLTDGFDDVLAMQGHGANEHAWFGDVAGGNGIDLQGFEITAITRTLLFYEVSQPGSDPNGDGIWTDVTKRVKFTIEGHPVPEPSSRLLMVAGAAAILLVGFQHSRRTRLQACL